MRSWGHIRTGATFEGLVATLVFFDDPRAALFGRPGKDGGQDARSGDRTRVFQAKFHEKGTGADAIADALREAAKIAKHRVPGAARYDQWNTVTHWNLVTNVEFNPNDEQRWDNEVVPAFARIGLVAEHWLRPQLDALLAKYPEIDRAFFGGEPRAFLSLPEAWEAVRIDEMLVVARGHEASLRGRDDELDAALAQLKKTEPFLIVSGPGGVGKTRFLLELGQRAADTGWQVLWANAVTMQNARWFEGLVAERETLLLLDEPEGIDLLKVLREQIGKSRAKQWKVAISVRSPRDPILAFLRTPGAPRSTFSTLGPLGPQAATDLALDLLNTGPLGSATEEWRRDASAKLARVGDRFPAWTSMAVSVLEQDEDLARLPENAEQLADRYIDEILRQQRDLDPERLLGLLRWLALLDGAQPTDRRVLDVIARETSMTTQAVLDGLDRLAGRRLLARRAHGVLAIKPDIVRDHILMRWFVIERPNLGLPPSASDDARVLAERAARAIAGGPDVRLGEAMLRALGRTELRQRWVGRDVDLLGPFLERVGSQLGSLTGSQRVDLVQVLAHAAPRSVDVLGIVARLRKDASASEPNVEAPGAATTDHGAVLEELPSILLSAAAGAEERATQRRILEELLALLEDAARVCADAPDDRLPGSDVLPKLVYGGPRVPDGYHDLAVDVVVDRLSSLRDRAARSGELRALQTFAQPLLALERTRDRTEGWTIVLERFVVLPGSATWASRERLVEAVWGSLRAAQDPEQARAAWALVERAHWALISLMGDGERARLLKPHALAGLRRASEALTAGPIDTATLRAARKLWGWHIEHEEDEELIVAARVLDTNYLSNELVREFDPITRYDRDERDERRKAEELASAPGAAIDEFLVRADKYLDPNELGQLVGVAVELGGLADRFSTVPDFIRSRLACGPRDPWFWFAARAAGVWLNSVRKEDAPRAARIVLDMIAPLPRGPARAAFLADAFLNYTRERCGVPDPSELTLLLAHERDFAEAGWPRMFARTVGWAFGYDDEQYRAAVESALARTADERRDGVFVELLARVDRALRHGDHGPALTTVFTEWLLTIWIRAGEIGPTGRQHLDSILRHLGYPHVRWLARVVAERAEGAEKARLGSLPTDPRWSELVAPIDATNAALPETVAAVDQLLACMTRVGFLFALPDYLYDVDPDGHVVPQRVADRVRDSAVVPDEHVSRFAHVARPYGVGSAPWRTIALAACARAPVMNDRGRRQIYAALDGSGTGVFTGRPGEVPEHYVAAAVDADRAATEEPDETLRPFFEWRRAVAKADLRAAEEEARAEREMVGDE